MIYIITILIAIILIMSYLLFTKDNNQQQKIDTQGFRNAVKYNLIIKVFLDIFSQSQQLNTKFEKLTGDNESLKQKIEKFEQQIIILHQEYQTILELTNKLQIQNTIFNQRNQDLETNQKSFIQKLGGIVYKENLEDKTWDLVLEKTQVLMNERNEALIKIQAFNGENEVLKQENKFLTQEKNNFNQSQEILKSIITTKDGDINSLTQKLMGLEFKVNELQSKPDHTIDLQNIQSELNKVQSLIIQKDAFIQTLEIEKAVNLQNISLLEANVITQKSNCESLTQEKFNLNNHVEKLESEIQSLNEKLKDVELKLNPSQVINNAILLESLQVQITKKDDDIQKLELEKNQNIHKIKQLEIKLTEKELELKTTIQDSHNRIQELKEEIHFLKQLTDKFGDSSGLIEELRKQITQKNDVIKKLESENYENLESIKLLAESFDELTENFDELTKNFKDKEYQLKSVTREKIHLDHRVKELEGENYLLIQNLTDAKSEVSKLQQNLLLMSQYADYIEHYADDLEQYADYIEQYADDLENYYLEELQRQPDKKDDDKDACIEKLESENYRYNTIIESLEDDIKKQESKLKVIKSRPRYWL